MSKPNKYAPDPPGYSRERPTASEFHQALNAAAGPGRWKLRRPGWREINAQAARQSRFRDAVARLMRGAR